MATITITLTDAEENGKPKCLCGIVALPPVHGTLDPRSATEAMILGSILTRVAAARLNGGGIAEMRAVFDGLYDVFKDN